MIIKQSSFNYLNLSIMYKIQTEYKGREVAFLVDKRCGIVSCLIANQLFYVEELSGHNTHAPRSILKELCEKEDGYLFTSDNLEKFTNFCKSRLKWSIPRHANQLCTEKKRSNPYVPNTGQWYLWEAYNKQTFRRNTDAVPDWDWSTK